MERRLSVALAVVLWTPVLAGCLGGSVPEDVDPTDTMGWTPCVDPWPCGDGSEWPPQLVAADHPRQPPVLPGGLTMEGADLVAANDTHATFAWTLPTVAAAQVVTPVGVVAVETPTVETKVTVPDGLFLRWDLAVELPENKDLREYDFALLDDEGETLCFTDHDLEAFGVQTGDSNVGCSTDAQRPEEVGTEYVVRVQHENDRTGDDVTALLTMEVAEPFLGFDALPVQTVRVPMADGAELDGAIWRPDLPDGVDAPVILYTTPYFGSCSAQGGFTSCIPGPADPVYLATSTGLGNLLQEGYAVAIFSVRGSGASGGCYDSWGPVEQQDHVDLVAWLADQPWSNGRVGMVGLSYAGTTPWEAAIHHAPGLKALVVGGIVTDVYTGSFTPQGAATDGASWFMASTVAANSFQPTRGDPDSVPTWAGVAPERACGETEREFLAHAEAVYTDDRDADWFADRRLIDRFPGVTAASLVLHGFEDDNFHRFQEDVIWDALPNAPKAMVLGQWDHTTYLNDHLANRDGPGSWFEMSKVWFDFWLKGLGEAPAMLGTVSYQDSASAWRDDAAWPPTAARDEALYLADGALQPTPGDSATFHAARSPTFFPYRGGNPNLCNPTMVPTDGRVLTYATTPLAEGVTIAGNPKALLDLTSDQTGGVVAVDLYVLPPDGACDEETTSGAADLRFHEGNFDGRDFPTGTSTPVRVDLYSAAVHVPAGHRLAVVLSGGGADYKQGQLQYAPNLEVAGTSHLVLPLVEGSLGGQAPTVDYPPRPFTGGNRA